MTSQGSVVGGAKRGPLLLVRRWIMKELHVNWWEVECFDYTIKEIS